MSAGERPPVAIGHVALRVQDVARAAAFYKRLGLRSIVEREGLGILELRGGTHLLLFRAKGKPRRGLVRSFDFMVDDVESFRDSLAAEGLEVGPLTKDSLSGHLSFEVTDPDGHVLTALSTHTEGRTV